MARPAASTTASRSGFVSASPSTGQDLPESDDNEQLQSAAICQISHLPFGRRRDLPAESRRTRSATVVCWLC